MFTPAPVVQATIWRPTFGGAGTVVPQAQAGDGYIYPGDGSSEGRYLVPRGYRHIYDAQGQQYYDNRGYAPQVYAPRPYAPRGLFTQE